MASVLRFKTGSVATVADGELDALANGSGVLGDEYNNATALDTNAVLELAVDFVSAPTAGSIVDVYATVAPDGTNYGDANAHQATALKVGEFVLTNTTAAQKCHCQVRLFPYKTKFYFVNRSGQAFPASGSTVKLYPYTTEVAAA